MAPTSTDDPSPSEGQDRKGRRSGESWRAQRRRSARGRAVPESTRLPRASTRSESQELAPLGASSERLDRLGSERLDRPESERLEGLSGHRSAAASSAGEVPVAQREPVSGRGKALRRGRLRRRFLVAGAAGGAALLLALLVFSDRESERPEGRGRTTPRRAPARVERAGSGRQGAAAPDAAARSQGRSSLPRIVGRIEDARGRPIPGAVVVPLAVETSAGHPRFTVTGPASTSSESGDFGLRIEATARLLRASAAGFATRLTSISPLPEGALIVVLLDARELEGLVVAAEHGGVLEGAQVSALGDGWQQSRALGGDGAFRFVAAPKGPLDLLVSAPGRVSRTVEVAPGARSLRVELSAGRRLAGRVVDPAGEPVPDAELRVAASSHPGLPYSCRSDADGRFELRGPAASDTVLIVAQAPGFRSSLAEPWRSAESLSGELRVTVWPSARLALIGDPASWQLRAVMSQPDFDLPEPVEGPEGLVYEGLGVGAYILEPSGGGGAVELRFEPGERRVVRLADLPRPQIPEGEAGVEQARVLSDAAPIAVRVVDLAGRPVAGAEVSAVFELPGVEPWQGRSDELGALEVPRRSTRVMLRAQRPGLLLVDVEECGPMRDVVELVLGAPQRIEGRIQPAVAARVSLIDARLGRALHERRCEAGEGFRFEGLRPGAYLIEVEAAGFRNAGVALELPGRVEPLVLVLEAGGHEHDGPDDPHDGE